MKRRPGYPEEIRERPVRLALTNEHDHSSPWAPISSIAAKIGCTPETLRSWIKKIEVDSGAKPGVSTDPVNPVKDLQE